MLLNTYNNYTQRHIFETWSMYLYLLRYIQQYLLLQLMILSDLKYIEGFDLTFQKWFVIFPNENNHKTNLKCRPPWLVDEEKFSVRIAWNSFKQHFLYRITSELLNNIRFIYYTRKRLWKRNTLKNCVKDHLCLNKKIY